MQRWPKDISTDLGGWRYINDYDQSDSDLSVTGWHLMFLRSARNAGFPVPTKAINDAVAYHPPNVFTRTTEHSTTSNQSGDLAAAGMAGAGILALGHAGLSQLGGSQASARRTCSGYSFEVYNGNGRFKRDRYHYSLFMCCQGMYQMGSPYWEQFFPRTVRAVLAHQHARWLVGRGKKRSRSAVSAIPTRPRSWFFRWVHPISCCRFFSVNMPLVRTILLAGMLLSGIALQTAAQTATNEQARAQAAVPSTNRSDDSPRNVLTPDEWRRVDAAVQRGLNFLISQQQVDGSFPTDNVAQPGVTSLCVLAFMANGHNPGNGAYGSVLDSGSLYHRLPKGERLDHARRSG